tara:strand:+ start:407 stop:802 length:396 start_codon:yes stop_codon:yes gene_type:complete
MSELSEYNSSLVEGEKKLETNEFFQDLCGLMENEQFKRFLDKHMSSWLDIKCSVTYMHLYKQFKERYAELNDGELDNRLAVYLLSKIMRDRNLRPWSIGMVDKMLENKKVDFFKEFESIMKHDNDMKMLRE